MEYLCRPLSKKFRIKIINYDIHQQHQNVYDKKTLKIIRTFEVKTFKNLSIQLFCQIFYIH